MIQISLRRRAWIVSMFALAATLLLNTLGSRRAVARQPQPVLQATDQSDLRTNTRLAIGRAVEYLLSQQAEDGGWHSEHYGAMKQGAANTSLVLYALSHLSKTELQTHAQAIAKAQKFLLAGIDKAGCVANPDGSVDYPVYSTALILTAHQRIDLKLTTTQVERMVQYLLDSQCSERRGFITKDPNHGGWDILGPGGTNGKTAGANVSVTFYVVQALSQFRKPADVAGNRNIDSKLNPKLEEAVETSLVAAEQWCERILASSKSGGFYFTSKRKSNLNKAGWNSQKLNSPRAYGSATCDGLGVLLMLEEEASSKTQKPINWLARHPGVNIVPGFKPEVDESGWPISLKFYYFGALSRSLDVLGDERAIATREAIFKQLLETQLSSGAWKNQSARMRENDELIATPFALISLLNCLK